MAASPNDLLASRHIGHALRRWRMLRRVKQQHAAELMNVSQSTISRWEAGDQAIDPCQVSALQALIGAPPTSAVDSWLMRLVRTSSRAVHLIDDLTHVLLAASPARAAEFNGGVSAFEGRTLLPYATEAIIVAETSLENLGWFNLPAAPEVIIDTGENLSPDVSIAPSRCRWTRIMLSSGNAARLVETIA